MEIKINEDRLKLMTQQIQLYFRDELEVSIGELKAELIVDFFIEKLGAQIYNQAIDDAQTFIQDKLIDLEGILYIPE